MRVSFNYVAVLAVSVVISGLSAFVVGLLAHRLSTKLEKRVVWAFSATVWVAAVMAVYSALMIQLNILLDPIVFTCVVLVTYVSARTGYRSSSSSVHAVRSAL